MVKKIDSRIPEGPVAEKWTNYKAHQRLVNPKNKLKLDVIVVGTGLAGASAAASLGEMGFNVYNFCIGRETLQFACHEVFGDDTASAAIDDYHILHLIACIEMHTSGVYLATEC